MPVADFLKRSLAATDYTFIVPRLLRDGRNAAATEERFENENITISCGHKNEVTGLGSQ